MSDADILIAFRTKLTMVSILLSFQDYENGRTMSERQTDGRTDDGLTSAIIAYRALGGPPTVYQRRWDRRLLVYQTSHL